MIYRNIGFKNVISNLTNLKFSINILLMIAARIFWNYIELYLQVIKLKEVQDAESDLTKMNLK